MLVGYARVSTAEQTLALQEDALRAAGCGKIFTDTIGGAQAERPGLSAALAYLRPGDALAVWRLDRLGRSLQALIEALNGLEGQGIGFRSLTEQLDTTTSGGKLIFHVFGALAEFERELIRERTRASLAVARARGRQGGRPKKLATPTRVALAQALYDDRSHSVAEICQSVFKVVKVRGVGYAVRHEHALSLRLDRCTVDMPAPPLAARHGPAPAAPFPPQSLRCHLL
jgi:DNA invertase Pin-like site-specific DNA recombinase